jgi:hypothetical protein
MRGEFRPDPKPAPREKAPRKPLAQKSPRRLAIEAGADRGRPDASSTLKRTGSLKPSRGKRAAARNADQAKAWREAVFALWFPGWTADYDDEIPCPASGVDLRLGWHPHHIIERKVLWDHGLATHVVQVVDRHTGEIVQAPAMYHPFIGMPVAPHINLGFENGAVEIPRHLIPRRTWDLAAALDQLDHLAGPEHRRAA